MKGVVPVVPSAAIKGDPQDHIAAFVMHTPQCGSVAVIHGDFVLASQIMQGASRRISLTIGQVGCECGCKAPGKAVMYTPEPEHARRIAAQLIASADEIENAARLQAEAVIAKAAGK